MATDNMTTAQPPTPTDPTQTPTTTSTPRHHVYNFSNIQEATTLLTVTAVGCLGNVVAMVTIICCRKFRKSSTAFICHQCFLDIIKCLYNFLYGYNLLLGSKVPICHAVGASFVFFMTVSAYNLLAIVVNEEFEIHRPSKKREKNHYCVIFGIATLWFMCILIDMGVAFLPKEPEFIPGVGSCIFSYGTPSNFVLHLLWIILISMAIFLALSHFLTMYCRIRFKSSVKWAFIHRTLLKDVLLNRNSNESDVRKVQNSCHSNNLYTHLYLKRIQILMCMVLSYIVFWYPLFTLTIIDYDFKQPKEAYKILTIIAWCHPATTPFFVFAILCDMSQKDGLMSRIYSSIYPMMQIYQNPNYHPMLRNELGAGSNAAGGGAASGGIQNTHFRDNTEDSRDEELSDVGQESRTLLHHATGADTEIETVLETASCRNSVIQTPIVIEQWDRSPTSPGRTRAAYNLNT